MYLMINRFADAAFVTAYSNAMHMDARHNDSGRQYNSGWFSDMLFLVGVPG